MPMSSSSGKDQIKWVMSQLGAKSALDIGPGCGTYAQLFPDLEWTGVEVWEPYVSGHNLRNLYSTLHVEDARTWVPNRRWDVAVAGDILEHMTEQEASQLLKKLRECADTVIVSLPIGYLPQGELEDNPYQAHVTDNWSVESAIKNFGEPDWQYVGGPQPIYNHFFQIAVLVYCNDKSRDKLKRPKICVYAISKNEAHFVPRFCDSAKDADLILIADTGSTDGLPDVAREHGAVVHDICITPWRFDLARNAALALVPRDFDVCVSLDIDEVLQPGWREEIERVWKLGETTRLRYMFDWGAGIQFFYEKIHARHGYMWHHPCHEYPVADGRITEVWADTNMLLAVHMPDPTKSRGQYMDLLELSVKEDPLCPRNAFYYARELSFNARWREAIDACDRYLKLPGATWENERCYAYRVMGRCYKELGEWGNAEKAFHQAASEASNTREPWCELSLLMYHQSRWEECFAFAMRAIRIKDRLAVYTVDPEVWGSQPHDLAAISAWQLGMKEIALEQASIAFDLSPHDQRLKANFEFMANETSAVQSVKTPNIIHFIYFGGRPYSFVNYLAVRAAAEHQKPDAIYMHCVEEPVGNPHWEAIRPYVTIRKMEDIVSFGDEPITWPHYKSDIARLQILLREGGVYLDNDMLMLKSVNELLCDKAVLSGEGEGCLTPAFIIAPANDPFLKAWIERMATRIHSPVWADHSVVLPGELARENPELIRQLPSSAFIPFDWRDRSIFGNDHSALDLKDTYAVHMWDTFWSEELLSQVDDEYLEKSDSLLASLFSKFARKMSETV
jgi:glycosyltransferase involved in cell wall biosynthesis